MSPLRWLFAGTVVLALVLALGRTGHASFVQTQRSQIAVYVLVNVTPAVGYIPAPTLQAAPIAARMRMRARGSGDRVDVSDFRLKNLIAQTQSDVRVQAEVSPNPNATLLYSNTPNVTISQTAGTTQATAACIYTVTVDTLSTTSWTLKDGLSNDFGTNFPGTDLKNNTYPQGGTPQPVATPFVVYPDNSSTWNSKESGKGMQTYCVTLTLTIPASVAGGAYSTNAIYTLYY